MRVLREGGSDVCAQGAQKGRMCVMWMSAVCEACVVCLVWYVVSVCGVHCV